MANNPKVLFDDYYKARLTPITCACCNICWLYIEGQRKGSCFYGGPYRGYLEIKEPPHDH